MEFFTPLFIAAFIYLRIWYALTCNSICVRKNQYPYWIGGFAGLCFGLLGCMYCLMLPKFEDDEDEEDEDDEG